MLVSLCVHVCFVFFSIFDLTMSCLEDGYTYERHEIEAWMATQIVKGDPVTSPRTNQVLSDLSLSPNISARNMAREFVSSESQKTWSTA